MARGWRPEPSVLGRLGSALLRKLQLVANPQPAIFQHFRDPKDMHLG
jgi:hypothetical protein